MTATTAAPGTIQVWSDLLCPFAHVAIHRLRAARARLGLDDQVRLDHHTFALELSEPPLLQAARASVARRAAPMRAVLRCGGTLNMATPWSSRAGRIGRCGIPVRLSSWARRSHPVVSKQSRS